MKDETKATRFPAIMDRRKHTYSIESTEFATLDTFLAERIEESNLDVTGITNVEEIALQIKDSGGQIIAGLSGYTWGGACVIRHLWIVAAHRKLGLGRRLMAAAETRAQERGCSQIVLSSHSFQAPQFYEKLGFARTGEIAGYPRGHSDILFIKHLRQPDAEI